MTKPELLLPAGNLENLKLAIRYGADAVYLGGQRFDWSKSSEIAWNGEWSVQTRRDSGGWEVVVSIPLKIFLFFAGILTILFLIEIVISLMCL